MEGVERVDGELDENRTGGPRLGHGQGFPDGRHDLPDGPDGGAELTQRLEEGHLVDVLQRSSPLSHKHSWRNDVETPRWRKVPRWGLTRPIGPPYLK